MTFLREKFAIARDHAFALVGSPTSAEHRIYKALRKLALIPSDGRASPTRTAAFLANLAEKGWPVYQPRPGRIISTSQRLDVATSILALVNAAACGEADMRASYKQLQADSLSQSSFSYIASRIADIEIAAATLDKANLHFMNMFLP